MNIKKLLNNNVVITEDENNQEIIVMGRGIGYKKSKGDVIEKEKINKVFRITNEEVSKKLQELLNNIPIKYIKLADEIVDYAQDTLNETLNESIYISLSDHIYTAIRRKKEGIEIKNVLLWELKKIYVNEFNIGKRALDLIENKIGVRLSEDEAGFIAFHIVSSRLEQKQPLVEKILELVQEILTIVRVHYGIEIKNDSFSMFRFITHLRFFATRVLTNKIYNDTNDNDLLEIVKDKYEGVFACVEKIQMFLYNKYKYELSSSEMVYLIIHIKKVVQDPLN